MREKAKISAEEANAEVRGWKNVMANGGMASMIAVGNFLIGGHEWAYFMLCSSVSVAASILGSEIGSLDPRTRIITTLEVAYRLERTEGCPQPGLWLPSVGYS